jgi:predicted lipoprotein with Yx(FWY)xxD motif
MRLSIGHLLTVALAVGATALVLAACGAGDSDDNGNATAADAGAGSGLVSVQSVDGTNVLADSEGRTLYGAEVEKGGQIECIDACTSFWEPVNASANEAESASADLDLELGVVDRPDGDLQLTFDGLPLYSFTEEGPGQLDGDGFVDDFEGTHFEWAVATTSGGSGSAGSDDSSESSGSNSPY